MDDLEVVKVLERIELLSRAVCVDESSDRDRQVALNWICELSEQVKEGVVMRNKKTTGSRWF
ncbi:hypothetical protein PEC331060_11860 [Pectobacterium carotovorum subsp. carotovorum]|nr:hypothetical protein PEC331060_11860 [Pectobacterium carotovorum subsp. carotovorum]